MSLDFKNAPWDSLKVEYRRIANEIGDDRFFTMKELHHLPKVLADGEQVLAFSSGLMQGHTWLIALTDRRVIFLDKGLLFGLSQSSIDLDKVNAVTGETGVFYGTITIEDSASRRTIKQVGKRTVIPFTNKMRDAMEMRKRPRHSPPAPTDDVVSKLERLAKLKESGILSQVEFDQQKARILAE